MLQDRFVKVMLVVIAFLLAANLMRQNNHATPMASSIMLPLESSAQAQTGSPASVRTVQGFNVADLQSIISLGDGKTFVVSNPKGFMVYTVESR